MLAILLSRDLYFFNLIGFFFVPDSYQICQWTTNRQRPHVRPCLVECCEAEKRALEYFGRLRFRLGVKYLGGSGQNESAPAPGITNVAVAMTNGISFI